MVSNRTSTTIMQLPLTANISLDMIAEIKNGGDPATVLAPIVSSITRRLVAAVNDIPYDISPTKLAKPEPYNIIVNMLDRRDVEFTVKKSATVLELKQEIEKREKVPLAVQRLVFGGKQMAEHLTMEQYGVEAGATVFQVRPLHES